MADYKGRMAGFRGEKSLGFYLSMLSNSKYLIFHGLRLLYREYYFQMDFFLLCSAFGIVLEVKNMSGELSFEKEQNQATCKRNGNEERIKNPVLQAKLQARKLKNWLREHNCPDFPILYFFINSNDRTIIRTEIRNEQITQHICNSKNLLEKIDQIEKYYKVEKLNKKELNKIKRLLLTNHTPDNPDILKTYHLSPNDIQTGVQCPESCSIPMVYKRGKWNCPKCNAQSNNAHIHAIHDYFLLIKPWITKTEFCQFLHIDSPHIGLKLLKSMNLPITGKFKTQVYHQTTISSSGYEKRIMQR
ncbi:nuclease-related domain-containing protein [Neobacillus bataviensis]|uniref:nuclease-related domain-containing protein n=1 Tax=Neobacillus bataviensis TaxID=220685 RepID=UPI001CBAAC11|nr:nuclease-related domain-containing protein [Neobacillus bataviensis]